MATARRSKQRFALLPNGIYTKLSLLRAWFERRRCNLEGAAVYAPQALTADTLGLGLHARVDALAGVDALPKYCSSRVDVLK